MPHISNLKDKLYQTSSILFARLCHSNAKISQQDYDALEDQLIMADVGISTTRYIMDELNTKLKQSGYCDLDNVNRTLKSILLSILSPVCDRQSFPPKMDNKPMLILVLGVNGVGKTTTIGKLAKHIKEQNYSILLAAGDTFRAAASEQLQLWGQQNDVPVVTQQHGADASAVIYDALHSARAKQVDVVIADTAGRLHNQTHLMQEIQKIVRVAKKFDEHLSSEIVLVLDTNTGQNAIAQAKQFHEMVGVNSLILTKLDGTTKGGVLFGLAQQVGVPIRFIGVGEGIDDLYPFDANHFVESLLSVP